MTLKEMLAAIATPLLRSPAGPLREMGDDELASAIVTLEERVQDGERVVNQLQPALETAAAEAFAGADLASVEGNATAMRKAEAALKMHRETLGGLRGEVERRVAESVIARRERRGKTLVEAGARYTAATLRYKSKQAEAMDARREVHAEREAVFRALPQKGRADRWPELLRRDKVDTKMCNEICGATNGEMIPAYGYFSPFEISQQPSLAELVAGLEPQLRSVVFGDDE